MSGGVINNSNYTMTSTSSMVRSMNSTVSAFFGKNANIISEGGGDYDNFNDHREDVDRRANGNGYELSNSGQAAIDKRATGRSYDDEGSVEGSVSSDNPASGYQHSPTSGTLVPRRTVRRASLNLKERVL